MQKSILIIQPPVDDESGKYLLVVTRGGGMMGGSSTVGFPVDRLDVQTDPKGRSYAIAAYRDYPNALPEKVLEFPLGTVYLLVLRNKVDFLTPFEAATRHKEEEDAVNQVYKDKGQGGEAEAEPTELPGGAVLFPGETQVFPDRMYR